MAGTLTEESGNICVKNGDRVGLMVRPDGSILTPNGGGGGNAKYRFSDIGVRFNLLAMQYCYEIGNGLYCVEIEGTAKNSPGSEMWEYGLWYDNILDFFGLTGKAFQYGDWEFFQPDGNPLPFGYMRYGSMFLMTDIPALNATCALFMAVLANGNMTNHSGNMIQENYRLRARLFIQ